MPSPDSSALLAGLAERVARRDLPPLHDYDPNDPAQVLGQVLAALTRLVYIRGMTARHCRARMLFEFVSHESRSSAELAHAAGLARVAGARAHADLERAGLLARRRKGPGHVFRLTRWGEDWLLAVARGEAPPARPGA